MLTALHVWSFTFAVWVSCSDLWGILYSHLHFLLLIPHHLLNVRPRIRGSVRNAFGPTHRKWSKMTRKQFRFIQSTSSSSFNVPNSSELSQNLQSLSVRTMCICCYFVTHLVLFCFTGWGDFPTRKGRKTSRFPKLAISAELLSASLSRWKATWKDGIPNRIKSNLVLSVERLVSVCSLCEKVSLSLSAAVWQGYRQSVRLLEEIRKSQLHIAVF